MASVFLFHIERTPKFREEALIYLTIKMVQPRLGKIIIRGAYSTRGQPDLSARARLGPTADTCLGHRYPANAILCPPGNALTVIRQQRNSLWGYIYDPVYEILPVLPWPRAILAATSCTDDVRSRHSVPQNRQAVGSPRRTEHQLTQAPIENPSLVIDNDLGGSESSTGVHGSPRAPFR